MLCILPGVLQAHLPYTVIFWMHRLVCLTLCNVHVQRQASERINGIPIYQCITEWHFLSSLIYPTSCNELGREQHIGIAVSGTQDLIHARCLLRHKTPNGTEYTRTVLPNKNQLMSVDSTAA